MAVQSPQLVQSPACVDPDVLASWVGENDIVARSIPVIQLSRLFEEPESAENRKAVVAEVAKACEEWGFFQVLNHGLSLDLMDRVFSVAAEFFSLPMEEKVKARPAPGTTPVATGFVHDDRTYGVLDPKEHFLVFAEGRTSAEVVHRYSQYNVWPEKPQRVRPIVEEFIEEVEKTSIYIMGLISQSLGLPPDFVHDYYKEKTNALAIFCYPPSPEFAEGSASHKDGNILTILAQNDVPGLQVMKDDKWITVTPIKGALVVNIGDMLQVDVFLMTKGIILQSPSHPTFLAHAVIAFHLS